MKTITLTISIFLLIGNLSAQVGGLSASKLGTLCTTAVPTNTIEFEPSFSFVSSTIEFDKEGQKKDLFQSNDSIQRFSNLGFRFTYGLMKNLEIGASLPMDMSGINFGIKYQLPIEGKVNFGVFGGYESVLGNKVYVKRNTVHESTSSIGAGMIMTYLISERFSVDFNAQYHKHIHTNIAGHDRGVIVSTDIGYYLIRNINFISGFTYSFNKNNTSDQFNSYLFTVNPGIAIEKAKHYILVLNTPLDLWGKNEYQTYGFGLALTILLD